MGSGRREHEPAHQPLRLMAQPDGYADYADYAHQGQGYATAQRGHGQHRYPAGRRRDGGPRAPRQRGRGTCLAPLAEAGADAGQIAYEMAVLVKRVGQHVIANLRFPVHDPVRDRVAW